MQSVRWIGCHRVSGFVGMMFHGRGFTSLAAKIPSEFRQADASRSRCNWAQRCRRPGLFDLDAMAHHPQFKLLETRFPAVLELPHPLPVRAGVGDVHDQPDEIVPVNYGAVAPVAFDLLGLVAGGTEPIDDFENCVGNPLRRDVAPVIEP